MHTLFTILVVVLLVGIAVGLVLQHRLYERLRSDHPRALAIIEESSAGIMAFQRYLWKRHYLGLGDALFTRRADFVRRYWAVWLLYFVLVALAVGFALGFGK
jgi:hypothetical protein